jgi:hypothetical protein
MAKEPRRELVARAQVVTSLHPLVVRLRRGEYEAGRLQGGQANSSHPAFLTPWLRKGLAFCRDLSPE